MQIPDTSAVAAKDAESTGPDSDGVSAEMCTDNGNKLQYAA